jgi:hypothetical protein
VPDPEVFDRGEAGGDDGSLVSETQLEEVGIEVAGPGGIDRAVVTVGAAAEREEVADEGDGVGCAGEVGDGGVVGLGCLFLMSCEFLLQDGSLRAYIEYVNKSANN